jgi:hypothetical protein
MLDSKLPLESSIWFTLHHDSTPVNIPVNEFNMSRRDVSIPQTEAFGFQELGAMLPYSAQDGARRNRASLQTWSLTKNNVRCLPNKGFTPMPCWSDCIARPLLGPFFKVCTVFASLASISAICQPESNRIDLVYRTGGQSSSWAAEDEDFGSFRPPRLPCLRQLERLHRHWYCKGSELPPKVGMSWSIGSLRSTIKHAVERIQCGGNEG